MNSAFQQVVEVLLSAGPVVIVICLVLLARSFDQRRAKDPERLAERENRLLQQSSEKITKQYTDRLPIAETIIRRFPAKPADVSQGGSLEMWFIVESAETERSPATREVFKTLEDDLRRELLLSGYFRDSGEILTVQFASQENIERHGWKYYLW